MYKALCVTAALLATFALTSASRPADASASSLPSPVIVAKGKVINQSAPIPQTTIFTPTQDGLYRISAYATITTPDPNSQSSYMFSFFWGDAGSASNATSLLFSNDNTPGVFGGVYPLCDSIAFQAKAGNAVSYSVSQSGAPDSAVYAIYFTIEHLE